MLHPTDEGYAVALADLLASKDADCIPEFLLRWFNSVARPHALLWLLSMTAPKDGGRFWRLVADAWCGFDLIPHGAYAAAFRRHRAAWSADAMQGENRAAFDALPTMVTAYRGQDASAPIGLSWTLRRDVAEGFAATHRGARHKAPAIFASAIPKAAVALVCDDREEAELVLFKPPSRRAVTPA